MAELSHSTEQEDKEGPPGASLNEPLSLNPIDRDFLAATIRLGQSGTGRTAPNPSVGALIVQFEASGPRIVGRGVTGKGGRPHGEVVALQQAGNQARGATCYVSLEPCAHHGQTPPCADALLRAGIARVVVAMQDPDHRVSGKGIALLSNAGVEVVGQAMPVEAYQANLGHMTRIRKGRPALTLKLAISRDDRIGRHDLPQGQGILPITGEVAQRISHTMRARADAVMVGVGTILADNPDLTCRLSGMKDWVKPRLIVDTHGRTPIAARIFQAIDFSPVFIFVGEEADPARVAALQARGARMVHLPVVAGRVSLAAMMAFLANEGMTHILAESGATLSSALLDAGFVDRVALFRGAGTIGAAGVLAHPSGMVYEKVLQKSGFSTIGQATYGDDILTWWGHE